MKTEKPIPKDKIFELMNIICKIKVAPPIEIGQIVCDNICGTRLVATKKID